MGAQTRLVPMGGGDGSPFTVEFLLPKGGQVRRGRRRIVARIQYPEGEEHMVAALPFLRTWERQAMRFGVGPIAVLASNCPTTLLEGASLAEDQDTLLVERFGDLEPLFTWDGTANVILARGAVPLVPGDFRGAANVEDRFSVKTWDDTGASRRANEFARLRHALDIEIVAAFYDDLKTQFIEMAREQGVPFEVKESPLPEDIRSLR